MRVLEQTLDLEGAHVVNRKAYKKVLWQRRCMAAATVGTLLGSLLFAVALIIPNWAEISFVNFKSENVKVQLGIWGEWRTASNTSEDSSGKSVEWIAHFPPPPPEMVRLGNTDLKHYYVAQATMGCITLVLMIFNNGLAVYTFSHHRYMYKRLVAIMHAFNAMCIVVTIEVLTKSVTEWNTAVAGATDWQYEAGLTYGGSMALAWFVFALLAVAAFIFFFSSHKQKGSEAATAEFEIEDRPVHIGR